MYLTTVLMNLDPYNVQDHTHNNELAIWMEISFLLFSLNAYVIMQELVAKTIAKMHTDLQFCMEVSP